MYKLICLDMDGTLLNSRGEVSQRNLRAIKLAHEKGVKVTVCTGRLFTSARFYADMLEVEVPVIASNGAYIREKDKNEVIYKSVLGYENSKKILEVYKNHNITFYFNTCDTVFMERLDPENGYVKINKTLPKHSQINIKVIEEWDKTLLEYEDEILKCICIDKDSDKIIKAKRDLLKLKELEVVSSASNNIEAMVSGASKGRAVEVLAGFYDLKREEIMCIGDNENDISMLQYAGMGVAMRNGENKVKEIADYVTDTNNDDGVAKAIEKFVLN